MEHMSEKELEQLRALQAKQKRVQRAEQEFFEEADKRKEELLARWGLVIKRKESQATASAAPSATAQTKVEFDTQDLLRSIQPS